MQLTVCNRCEKEIVRREEGQFRYSESTSLFSMNKTYHFILCGKCEKHFKGFMKHKPTSEPIDKMQKTHDIINPSPQTPWGYPQHLMDKYIFNDDVETLKKTEGILKTIMAVIKRRSKVEMDELKELLNKFKD